ncbi:hypothetical protein NDU88_004481 [Pleurodeles waltl]|uniref:Uncharacterized protein n=1 Tax=Pleurodeles waltl TaxID=8319 RepID=A0AAV7SIZ2_PLEWA|nr:hypothetical protein NDU88_004481 [Pleurodeles waltl]
MGQGASSGALSDLRVGVSRVSFPGSPSQGASPVLFLDPDQVTGVPLSFSPQGVRGKHGSAQRSGASRFGSSLGTRLFYGLRSPRDGAVVTEDGVRPYPRWRSRHRRQGTSLSKMAQSSQKTGYVLIQDGAVLTEDGGGLAPPRSLSPLRLCRTRGRAASVVAVPRSRGSVPGVPRGRGHPLVPARRDSHPRHGDCGSPEAPGARDCVVFFSGFFVYKQKNKLMPVCVGWRLAAGGVAFGWRYG